MHLSGSLLTAAICDESISLFGHTVGVHVVSAPTDQYVSVNDTLLLTCNISGSEPISYQWFKDGQQLQDGGRVSGSNSSRLEVKPVDGNDFGNYQCNASNDVDQALSEVAQVEGILHVDFMDTCVTSANAYMLWLFTPYHLHLIPCHSPFSPHYLLLPLPSLLFLPIHSTSLVYDSCSINCEHLSQPIHRGSSGGSH